MMLHRRRSLARLGRKLGSYALIVVSTAAGCVACAVVGSACSGRDERLEPILAKELDSFSLPPGTEIVQRYSGCDADDLFAYAGRHYSAPTTSDVPKFLSSS